MARQVDDGGWSRAFGDSGDGGLEVDRTARQEGARRCMCIDGRDPNRQAPILPAFGHGEVAGPEDVDMQVAAREAIPEARDFGPEPV
jgi:hypothetical protein